MTQKLQELFNLAPTEEPTVEDANTTIEENRAMLWKWILPLIR